MPPSSWSTLMPHKCGHLVVMPLPLPLFSIPQVPIMLRSSFCSLFDHTDKELTELGEDPYDQVRGKRRGG